MSFSSSIFVLFCCFSFWVFFLKKFSSVLVFFLLICRFLYFAFLLMKGLSTHNFLIKIFYCFFFKSNKSMQINFLKLHFLSYHFFFLNKKKKKEKKKKTYSSAFQPGNQTSWTKIKVPYITHFLITDVLAPNQTHP